jgi:hypothetical protein
MKLTGILAITFAMGAVTTQAHTDEIYTANEPITQISEQVVSINSDYQPQDEYSFDTQFDLKIEEFDKKGKLKQSSQMTMMVSEESKNMAMVVNQEGINTEVIFDMDSKNIITLMNTGGQKMATSMSLDNPQFKKMMEESQSADESNNGEMPTFKKTGKSKTISGYSCDEYKVEHSEMNEDSEVTYWITEEAEFDWVKSMSNMAGINKQMPDMSFGTGYPEDGSIIQMVVTEKSGTYTVMTVTDIEQDADITVSTKGYTFMNMGNMGGR